VLARGIGLGTRRSAREEEMGRAGDVVKAEGALAGLQPGLGPRRGARGWPKSKGAGPAPAENRQERGVILFIFFPNFPKPFSKGF
jgi:hypothetical protein